MDTINTDILQLISEYLEYTDLFTINILSKNINYIFKNCGFNSVKIHIKNEKIVQTYSFKNIEIYDLEIIKFLNMNNVDKLKLQTRGATNIHKYLNYFCNIRNLDLSYTKIKDVSKLGKIHTLNLSHTIVRDVRALCNVYELNLSNTLFCLRKIRLLSRRVIRALKM